MNSPVSSLSLRQRLRALPVFPEIFPPFEAGDGGWPEDPAEAFVAWLETAVDRQVVEPHAATLSTADADGAVSARTLILKDIVDNGWQFATHRGTRKVEDIEANPRAALTFYWPEVGRQVSVRGRVVRLDDETSAADYRQRPLAGTDVDPDWRAFAVVADYVEFWQASPDRAHRRIAYSRADESQPFERTDVEPRM